VLVVLSGAELLLASSVWPAPHDEAVVSEIIGRVLGTLLGQGEQVAEGKRAPAKVFVLLDMVRNLGVGGWSEGLPEVGSRELPRHHSVCAAGVREVVRCCSG
jgi:hypothetical protein